MSVLEWALNRGLDLQIAAGEVPPGWLVLLGLTLFGSAVAVLTWLVVGWWERRSQGRNQPEPESLLVEDGWLAEDGPEVPGYRYRGQRRAPRNHVVPAHPLRAVEPVTQVIPRVSDEPDATIAIPKTYGGAR